MRVGDVTVEKVRLRATRCVSREPKIPCYASSMSEETPSQLTQDLAHHLAGERAHTLPTILLIAKIERRQTFIEEGFSSIWDYLRRVHKQSDTMIHCRVSCARAVNRFPQVIEQPIPVWRLDLKQMVNMFLGGLCTLELDW